MKFMIMIAASAVSATLVVPTVTQSQAKGIYQNAVALVSDAAPELKA